MADLAAVGPLSTALLNLRTLIANIAWFQNWAGPYVVDDDGNRVQNEDGQDLQIQMSAADALNKIIIGAVGYNVESVAIASGIATITTRQPHNLVVDQFISIEGVSLFFDGAHVVASVPDSKTFTFETVEDDVEEEERTEGVVMQTVRPFVVLQESNDDGLKSQTVATGPTSIFSGAIDIFISGEISVGLRNDPRNAKIEMSNWFGQFISELSKISGTADYMVLNSIEPRVTPSFVNTQEQSDNQTRYEQWEAMVRVTWGLEG